MDGKIRRASNRLARDGKITTLNPCTTRGGLGNSDQRLRSLISSKPPVRRDDEIISWRRSPISVANGLLQDEHGDARRLQF